jgi:hypothetical protein
MFDPISLGASVVSGLFSWGKQRKAKRQINQINQQIDGINAEVGAAQRQSSQQIDGITAQGQAATNQAIGDSQVTLGVGGMAPQAGNNAIMGDVLRSDGLNQQTAQRSTDLYTPPPPPVFAPPPPAIEPAGSPAVENTTIPDYMQPTYAGSGNWFDASFGGPQSGPSANSGGA